MQLAAPDGSTALYCRPPSNSHDVALLQQTQTHVSSSRNCNNAVPILRTSTAAAAAAAVLAASAVVVTPSVQDSANSRQLSATREQHQHHTRVAELPRPHRGSSQSSSNDSAGLISSQKQPGQGPAQHRGASRALTQLIMSRSSVVELQALYHQRADECNIIHFSAMFKKLATLVEHQQQQQQQHLILQQAQDLQQFLQQLEHGSFALLAQTQVSISGHRCCTACAS